MVVAYLMTVTHYSWEECLSAVKAVRSFVGPNYGFQQQLQEYQTTQVSEVNMQRNREDMNSEHTVHYLQNASNSLLLLQCFRLKSNFKVLFLAVALWYTGIL